MAQFKTYYEIAREKLEKAQAKLDEFDARESEFSPENFQRRRKQYVDKVEKARVEMQKALSNFMELVKQYQEEHPDVDLFEEDADGVLFGDETAEPSTEENNEQTCNEAQN
jgi:uncharacterized protein Yka (UPF0111/DUF47 family)